MSGGVRTVHDGQVAIVTLENPPLNIVTASMREDVIETLSNIAEDNSVRCVVMTGAGERSFCAGANMGDEQATGPDQVERLVQESRAFFGGLEELRVPVIAAISGHCMGAGLELALACDIRIVAHDAQLCGAGVKVGVVVSATRLTRLIGPAGAKDLLLTGRTFTGDDAFRMGLASSAVPRGEVLDVALAWAHEIASRAPLAVERTKQAIHEATESTFDESLNLAFGHYAELAKTEDHQVAVAAFFAKETPKFHRR